MRGGEAFDGYFSSDDGGAVRVFDGPVDAAGSLTLRESGDRAEDKQATDPEQRHGVSRAHLPTLEFQSRRDAMFIELHPKTIASLQRSEMFHLLEQHIALLRSAGSCFEGFSYEHLGARCGQAIFPANFRDATLVHFAGRA